MGRDAAILAVILVLAGGAAGEARAEVRLGDNVFIGGHDFSHRRYHSITITRTSRRPPWLGCRHFAAGKHFEGRRLRRPAEVCYLRPMRRG